MHVRYHHIGRDPYYKVWHNTEKNMIIYMHSDGGSIVFQDKIYPIKKGALYFVGPNEQLYTMPDKPTHYDRSKIFLPQSVVNDFLEFLPEKDDFYNLFTTNSVVCAIIPTEHLQKVEDIFEDAQKSFYDEKRDTEAFICCFFRLMSYIKKYATEHISAPRDSFTRAIEIINQNYGRNISLDNLSNEIHMSKYHFCRKFKTTVGVTVMEAILRTRLAAAQNALSESNLTISEISDKCGFSSVSYFCQIFKKRMGITPLEYRRKSS